LAGRLSIGGRIQSLDALFVSPRYRLNSEVAEKIGCTIEAGPLGRVVATDEFKSTNVDGVAVGDI
jgi:hypothetical protein